MRFKLPLQVRTGKTEKSKKFILNMNNYRNVHFLTLNKSKIAFKEQINDQLSGCPKFDGKIQIEYTLFPGSARKGDMDNVLAVVKKYFQDALTESGIIGDDTMDVIVRNIENVGNIDRENPRVEAVISSIEWHDIYESTRSQ